jgi:LysM repeat protein
MMRKCFYLSILVVIGTAAIYVSASQLIPKEHTAAPTTTPTPGEVFEDWIDVWATYKLEAIPTRPAPHIVQPGETLWDIASEYRLPGDLRMTLDIIRELNSLWGPDGPMLRAGQRLRVPETDADEWPLAMKWCWGSK